MALGIAAFALVPIVALLPVGLKSAGDSNDESRVVNLLNALVSDRKATPLDQASIVFKLPVLTPALVSPVTGDFGISEDDKPVSAADMAKARYRVSYRVIPPAAGSFDPYLIRLRVSWPAQNVTSPEALEIVAAYPQS
jgi:hypothetical protein